MAVGIYEGWKKEEEMMEEYFKGVDTIETSTGEIIYMKRREKEDWFDGSQERSE